MDPTPLSPPPPPSAQDVSKPDPPRPATHAKSIVIGAGGLALVGFLIFATVALGERWLYRWLGTSGAYAFWTALFLLGLEAVARRLVAGAKGWGRAVVAAGFFTYALAWVAGYFYAHGLMGEWIGAVAGPLCMAALLAVGFSNLRVFDRVALVLCIGHGAGYFLGRWLWVELGGKTGMIGWGIVYGLGFGAGIGSALFELQRGRSRAAPLPAERESRDANPPAQNP